MVINYGVQKLWTLLFYRQPPICSSPLFPHLWQYLFGNIVQMKHMINTQKTHKRKLFLQNFKKIQINTFVSNTVWDLIQNSNHLRYHKDLKGILMQIWKCGNILVVIWKYHVEDFTLKHLLLFEICAREIFEKFVYKHSETIEYVKN